MPALRALNDTLKSFNDEVDRAQAGGMTNAERNTRTAFNYLTTGQGVDQPPGQVFRADAAKVERERIEDALAELNDKIAAERTWRDRIGSLPLVGGKAKAPSSRRLDELEAERKGLADALDARDEANLSLGEAEATARRLARSRLRQSGSGLDPFTEGRATAPEFGAVPTTDPRRNLSFGLHGAPDVRPVYGATEKPEPPPPIPSRMLQSLDDVLNGRRERRDDPARVGFDLRGAALAGRPGGRSTSACRAPARPGRSLFRCRSTWRPSDSRASR